MKTRTCAIGIAAVLFMAACGGGSDNDEETAVSGPAPAPAPGPTPTPTPGISGADIDMTQAFSQTLNCYYGEKPYYDTNITGPWTVAFDGDLLSLSSTVGNQSFGGRFSQNSEPVRRENDADTATLSTFIGGGGSGGNIFFTKAVEGTVTRAGHHQFGGTNPRRDVVECGSDRDNQWLALPASSPFTLQADDFSWADSQIQLKCATRPAGSTTFNPTVDAVFASVNNGPMVVDDGTNTLFGLQSVDEPNRTESVPIDSPRVGASIWQSIGDADNSNISISLGPTNRMLIYVREELADGQLTNCEPAPLDPTARFSAG